MFQAYNYNFNLETQANLDDADLSAYCHHKNNAINQYNASPSSLECSPQMEDAHLEEKLDNSFEKDSQATHAQQIWKASLSYIQTAIETDERGFNNDAIYRSYTASHLPTAPLSELIKSNKLFRANEKKDFIQDLEKESEVCGLLVELMLLFNQKIFNEVAFAVYRIWSSRYKSFRQNKTQKPTLFSSFSNFFGFEQEEKFSGNTFSFSNEGSNASEIVEASSEGMEELARELFHSKKFKYLNLQEVKSTNLNRSESITEFTAFLKSISKAVFLSAEGIYEEETIVSSFSEEEEDGDSFGSTGSKFARLFSQLQEDNEEAYPTTKPSKHIKLF